MVGAPPHPRQSPRPHRLAVQDIALSRRRRGFESRWGHAVCSVSQGSTASWSKLKIEIARSRGEVWSSRRPVKAEVAGSNPVETASHVRCIAALAALNGRERATRAGSSVGTSIRLKSGGSAVRSRPCPPTMTSATCSTRESRTPGSACRVRESRARRSRSAFAVQASLDESSWHRTRRRLPRDACFC